MKNIIKPAVIRGKTTLRVLKYGVKTDPETVQFTDLKTWVHISGPAVKACKAEYFDPAEFNKTGDLEKSAIKKIEPAREDFPQPISGKGIKILSHTLARCLPDFNPFLSLDFSSRLSLTGVYYNAETGDICATDGHRMKTGKDPKHLPGKGEFIFPKSAGEIMKIMEKHTMSDCDIVESKGTQFFRVRFSAFGHDVIYHFTMVEGPYPQYQKVIPRTDLFREYTAKEFLSIHNALKEMKSYKFDPEHGKGGGIYAFRNSFYKETISGFREFPALDRYIFSADFYLDEKYLWGIFQDIKTQGKPVHIYNTDHSLKPIKIDCGPWTYIPMPKRYMGASIEDEVTERAEA